MCAYIVGGSSFMAVLRLPNHVSFPCDAHQTHGVQDIHVSDDGTIQISSLDTASNTATQDAILKIVADNDMSSSGGPGQRRSGGGKGRSSSTASISSSDQNTTRGDAVDNILPSEPPETGLIYRGCKIMGIHNFGLFVEVTRGHEGLVHVSELDIKRVASVLEAGFVVGERIDVKCLGRNDKGQLRLSRRAVLLRDSGVEVSSGLSPGLSTGLSTGLSPGLSPGLAGVPTQGVAPGVATKE